MKTCRDCGGEYDSKLPKCPYCGEINVEGAEAEYFGKLETIKGNLFGVKKAQKEAVKKELSIFLIAFVSTVLVVGGLTLIAISSINRRKPLNYSVGRTLVEEKIKDISEMKELVSSWDKLYEEGKYDELCEKIYEDSISRGKSTFLWKHFSFYNSYSQLKDSKERLDAYLNGDTLSSYEDISDILYHAFYGYTLSHSDSNKRTLSKEEFLLLEEKFDSLSEEICESLSFDRKDYDSLRISTCGAGIPARERINEFVKERFGE